MKKSNVFKSIGFSPGRLIGGSTPGPHQVPDTTAQVGIRASTIKKQTGVLEDETKQTLVMMERLSICLLFVVSVFFSVSFSV